MPRKASDDDRLPRVVLNRIMISFEPNEESHMIVELAFTNEGRTQVSDAFTTYFEIDDEAGQNRVRRALAQIDFRNLALGQRVTFSDRLLVSPIRPGRYAVYLWIPRSDPSLKFHSSSNLLLSSIGVADPKTGLNRVATFTVLK